MLSMATVLLFFIFSMICSVLSGWIAWILKVEVRFPMILLTRSRGSPGLIGRLFLNTCTLLTKKLFMVLASSAGFANIVPLLNSFLGGPPDVQPSHPFILFQV